MRGGQLEYSPRPLDDASPTLPSCAGGQDDPRASRLGAAAPAAADVPPEAPLDQSGSLPWSFPSDSPACINSRLRVQTSLSERASGE
jgi:hypothetical protein